MFLRRECAEFLQKDAPVHDCHHALASPMRSARHKIMVRKPPLSRFRPTGYVWSLGGPDCGQELTYKFIIWKLCTGFHVILSDSVCVIIFVRHSLNSPSA